MSVAFDMRDRAVRSNDRQLPTRAQIAAITDVGALVREDREDEIGLPAADRDEKFLAKTGSVLRALNATRTALSIRRGVLRKNEDRRVQAGRERAFIDAARTVLDRETYLSIWAVVDAGDRRTEAST